MQEYLDIFDKNENHLGCMSREDCHKPNVNFYHRVVWIWIFNDKQEILIQQRALSKKNRPGCWDEISVGGHVAQGESTEQACVREMQEELGIKAKRIKLLTKWILEETKEIVYFYASTTTKKQNQFVLQKEEVADAKFINFDEYKNMLNSNVFGEYPQEYKNLVITQLTSFTNNNTFKKNK